MPAKNNIEEIIEIYHEKENLNDAVKELQELEPNREKLQRTLESLANYYYDEISIINEILIIVKELKEKTY